MAKFSCFSMLVGSKKKSKVVECPDPVRYGKGFANGKALANAKGLANGKGLSTPQGKLKQPVKSSEHNELNSTSFSFSAPLGIQENSTCKVKVLDDEKALGYEQAQAAYEAEDEHDEKVSIKRDFSDLDLQALESERGGEVRSSTNRKTASFNLTEPEMERHQSERNVELVVELIQSGHVSDPGMGKAEFLASPGLQRSCSNLETRNVQRKMADGMPPVKYRSFKHSQSFVSSKMEEFDAGIQGSPESVMTSHSADRVMLRKQSSSQILPSRSRKLWWKMFLWSHRNLEKSRSMKALALSTNQKGGYSSDTVELNQAKELGNMGSPGSFTGESHNNSPNWNKKFHSGASGLWPQNQWVAFPAGSSSMTRVDQWVNSLETQPPLPVNAEDMADEDITFPPSPDASPHKSTSHMNHRSNNVSEEDLYASNVVQSLNSSSTVAHITCMGLNVIPPISGFSSLRSVNLSGNFIVHITPGSLPKGLHALNLSRNKIVSIDGLRDLTRLRVLDLSYNRISRIGQGLSYCTLIKELYLAGNKISDVEGLHRLLKLMVLDLSFNKITTAKSLGQLVANYNSLLALNLLGNPIHSNMGEERLRKTVTGILPQLSYLNKQPIKPNGAREVTIALGVNEWTSRRNGQKRASIGRSSSSRKNKSTAAGTGQKTGHRSKKTHDRSPSKRKSSSRPSLH